MPEIPADFDVIEASPTSGEIAPDSFKGDSLKGMAEFYGVPTEDTYSPQRMKDFEGDRDAYGNVVPKFAQEAKKQAYESAPAFAQKLYDSRAEEFDDFQRATGGKYSDEFVFGDDPMDFVWAADIERSKNIDDKVAKFRKHFPDGEIQYFQRTNGTKILLGRKHADANWTKIDTLVPKAGAALGSAATAGAVIGEALGYAGGGTLGGAFGAAVGGVLGDMADTAIEKFKGYSQEESYSNPGQPAMAAMNAAFSWLGRGGIVGFTAGKFLKEGASTAKVRSAAEFAEKEGLPALTKGQATINPLLSNIYRQAVNIDAATNLSAVNSANSATKKFIEFANESSGELNSESLRKLMDTARYNVGKAISTLRSKEIAPEDAGRVLGDAFDNWEAVVDGPNGYLARLYKEAERQSVDINWDISNVKAIVNKYREGTLGRQTTEEAVDTGLVDARGAPITRTETVEKPIKLSEDPRGELAGAMDAVQRMDSLISRYNAPNGNTYEALQQLKDLRTRFRRLSYSDDPGIAGIAKQIHKELTNTFENGISVNGDPTQAAVANDAIKKANREYRAFMELTDLRPIKNIQNMGPGDYSRIVENIVQPGKSEAMKLIANVVPEGQETLRKVYLTRLFSGERTSTWEDSITKELDRWARANDQAGLSFLLKPGEKNMLINYAKDRDRLESGLLSKLAGFDRDASALAWKAVSDGSPEDLKYILELAGGRGSKEGMALRRGILQRLYEKSAIQIPKMGDVLAYDKFTAELNSMENRGTLQTLFSKKEIDFLRNMEDYIEVVKVGSDMGTSLQAAEVSSGIAQIPLKAGEEFVAKGAEKATKKVYDRFVLPISMKMAGSYLLQPAGDAVKKPTAGKIAKKTATWLAARTAATMLGKEISTEENNPLPNVDAALFNYPGALGGFK